MEYGYIYQYINYYRRPKIQRFFHTPYSKENLQVKLFQPRCEKLKKFGSHIILSDWAQLQLLIYLTLTNNPY